MSKNKNKKIFAGSMAAVLLLGASSLAWFTDRTEGSIEGQAGSLCIAMSEITGDLSHLAPGDSEELSFTYENSGSLAMDTRVTYALTYELDEDVKEALGDDALYQLDKIATVTVGENEFELTADEQNKASVTVEAGILNGTKESVEGGADSLEELINFKFDESVGNLGQSMKFKLDILIEGKQNRNEPEWTDLEVVTIEFGANEEQEVVKEAHCQVVELNEGPPVDEGDVAGAEDN